MKYYKKSNYTKKQFMKYGIVATLLLVVVGTGSSVFNLYSNIGKFAMENPIATDSFKTANLAFLEEIAYNFDDRYPKYHLPLNQSSTTTFNNDSAWNGGVISYTNVSKYHFSDNEALWTGIDYTGWVYKYLVAKQTQNTTMEQYALDTLINMTTGLSLLMAVPNGGLGPEYGGVLARGTAPPGSQNIWNYIFEEDVDSGKHFNGTGEYSQWRYRAYTSKDEYGGYYLFLAIATKYMQDIPLIKDRVSLIVDQICQNWIYTNFLGIHGAGATTGVNQKPVAFTEGFWAPLIFKLGSIYYPEKYERYYHQYVSNEMYYLSNAEGGAQESFANYYAYNFAHCVVLAFLITEDPSTPIWKNYFKGYTESLRTYTKTHRNAWFNAIYLMIVYEAQPNSLDVGEDLEQIANDVKDQLQRYGERHSPALNYLINISIPEGYQLIQPIQGFVDALGLNAGAQRFLGISGKKSFLDKPLTVDMREGHNWIWEKNPFIWAPDTSENLLVEYSGTGFTVPYWMLRYCGYLGGTN